MPELEAIRAELAGQGIGFTAVALSDDRQAVQRAASSLGLSMPIALAQGETLSPNGLNGIPALLLVDAQGKVVDRQVGLTGHDALLARVRALAAMR